MLTGRRKARAEPIISHDESAVDSDAVGWVFGAQRHDLGVVLTQRRFDRLDRQRRHLVVAHAVGADIRGFSQRGWGHFAAEHQRAFLRNWTVGSELS